LPRHLGLTPSIRGAGFVGGVRLPREPDCGNSLSTIVRIRFHRRQKITRRRDRQVGRKNPAAEMRYVIFVIDAAGEAMVSRLAPFVMPVD
jgi:hypothetical protein